MLKMEIKGNKKLIIPPYIKEEKLTISKYFSKI